MRLIGITGGIGTGKTTITAFLQKSGVATIDTDVIARELTDARGDAIAPIRDLLGDAVFLADGGLDRSAVAERVFRDPALRKGLEGILHPRIRSTWRRRVEEYRAAERDTCVVIIPLLFETGAEKAFDLVMCVACREREQMERLLARGWSREHSEARLASQWPLTKKMAAADRVIWTSCAWGITERQLKRVLDGGTSSAD